MTKIIDLSLDADAAKAARDARTDAHRAWRARRKAAQLSGAATPPRMPRTAKAPVSPGLIQSGSTPNAAGILGALAFWSLRDVSVERADLRAALEAIGLGFASSKDPKPQACLRMAVEIVRRSTTSDVVFDRVSDSPSEIVYAMSSRSADQVAEVATYQHRTRVRLDKASGALSLEDTTDETLLAVAAKYRHLITYLTTAEFGMVLVNALRGRGHSTGLSAINVRGDAGGVYFVSSSYVETLGKLADIVDGIVGRGAFTVWPILANDRAAEQTSVAVRTDLTSRVQDVRLDVRTLLASVKSDAGSDLATRQVAARVAAFDGLRSRIEAYSEILGELKSGMLAEVEDLRAALAAAVGAAMPDDDFADNDFADDASE